ncbi:MAG: hypothetical protein IT371_15045 [Deltaproteobacteria bacterium]|nr:hypothetical protein [Deltaproteobacteria bacterium]
MRRSVVLATLGIWTAFAAPARADVAPTSHAKKVVAVLPFSSPSKWSELGRNAQETFVTQLVNARQIRVVQANLVERMLKRRGLHYTGTVEPAILRAAGTWLKADFVLAGKLRYGGDAYVLSAHVMNVRTLETTMAEDVDFSDLSKMRVAVRALAKKISGTISGQGSSGGGKSADFLNVNARAFYDTSDACIRVTKLLMNRFRFTGTVETVDDEEKTITVKGYAGHLKEGVPLDIYSTGGIDGDQKITSAWVTRKTPAGFEAKVRFMPDDGIELGAKITNYKRKWVIAVGKVEDEVEDNEKLVEKFRDALLEKMSEGDAFEQIEGDTTDLLAKLSSRKTRFFAFKKLHERGVDLVLEGKFYGSSGSRRAHFKVYSTATGKIWGEPKFETSL